MRKIIFAAVLGFIFSLGAYSVVEAGNMTCEPSDPCGGWVKVDASGAVISSAVVCNPSTCGDANSWFSQQTLKNGEQWVQQVHGNAGAIGNNSPSTTVTYDRTSETFTVVVEPASPAPTDSNPQPTQSASQPEATSVPQVEATSVPQATAEPTQSAPQPTATAAPTDAPTAVPVVTVVPLPPTDLAVYYGTFEFKLSDTIDPDFSYRSKRRIFGEMIAI